MKSFVIALLFSILSINSVSAQPMSGAYTIGGVSADFDSVQHAADAVRSRGITGPVFFNIRPGTYMRTGGGMPVLIIDSSIAGVSASSMITFQPDFSAGGNINNVILQSDFNPASDGSLRAVVIVGADYIAFRHLTFKDADSLDTPAGYLIRGLPGIFNPVVKGLTVDDCTFIGSPYFTHGAQFGTDHGIGMDFRYESITVTRCRFRALLRPVSATDRLATLARVEQNDIAGGYQSFSGSSSPLGVGIDVSASLAIVRENVVRANSGIWGIRVSSVRTANISRNLITGFCLWGLNVGQGFVLPDSIDVVNNIIDGTADVSLFADTRNTRFFHNTLINSGGFGSGCFSSSGDNCTILNNVFVNYNGRCNEHGNAAGVVSDFNLFFSNGPEFAVHNGIVFPTFETYTGTSHLDSNSHFQDVTFQFDSLGPHLEECDAQNPALNGTPLRSVPFDFYDAPRDTVRPFVGAVEGTRLAYDMFADVYKTGLTGVPFSLASATFESGTGPGIVVPDYANRLIRVFHNLGHARSFSQTGTVFTTIRPVVVAFADMDRDTHVDLIVAGDTSAVEVFWGDGSGSFGPSSIVGTLGPVRSMAIGERYGDLKTIIMAEDNSLLPTASFVGFLLSDGNRNVCHAQLIKGGFTDTIQSVLGNIVRIDKNHNGRMDIAAVTIAPLPAPLITITGIAPATIFGGTPCFDVAFLDSTESESHLNTGDLTFASSLVAGDFDGDGDNDLVANGISENTCVFMKNDGHQVFTAETLATTSTRGWVALDYDNDGDLDFVGANRTLEQFGMTVFLNDGTGHFTTKRNCFYPFASGRPTGIIAADFDADGKTDIAITTFDSLFVLYNLGGFNGTTGITDYPSSELPRGFSLLQNYPNPFNPSTRIEYVLPSASDVAIRIYNLLGEEIATLVDEQETGGRHVVEWNGRSSGGRTVSSGVYFYRVEARAPGGQFLFTSVKKMMLLK